MFRKALILIHARTHVRAQTHARTRAHTHARAHTHTQPPTAAQKERVTMQQAARDHDGKRIKIKFEGNNDYLPPVTTKPKVRRQRYARFVPS